MEPSQLSGNENSLKLSQIGLSLTLAVASGPRARTGLDFSPIDRKRVRFGRQIPLRRRPLGPLRVKEDSDMSMRVICSLLGLALAIGCATSPRPRTIVKDFDMEVEFDEVWPAVIETLAELNIPIDNLEKDSGLITTDWLGFGASYCDCGDPGITSQAQPTGKFNVFVKRAPHGVTVTVNARYKTIRTFLDESSEIHCVSTGKLEETIEVSIASKLGLTRKD